MTRRHDNWHSSKFSDFYLFDLIHESSWGYIRHKVNFLFFSFCTLHSCWGGQSVINSFALPFDLRISSSHEEDLNERWESMLYIRQERQSRNCSILYKEAEAEVRCVDYGGKGCLTTYILLLSVHVYASIKPTVATTSIRRTFVNILANCEYLFLDTVSSN